MMKSVSLRTASIFAAMMIVASAVYAAGNVKLPKHIAWTAFGTTSSGYAQSVGIGQMLSNRYNVDLRIIPGENDVGRMIPLTTGTAKICACGIASYFAQEGVLMFAERRWGPQRISNLFNNLGRNGQTAAIAADTGVKSVSDLKGKRVTWLKGSPANNTNMAALLAYGGLTWKDVVKVEVPGWRHSMEAVLNGQADAAWASTLSSALNRIAASPRGLYFPPLPHADKKAWARAEKIAPWFAPAVVEDYIKSAKIKGAYEGMNYPYPLFVAVDDISDELAYGLTYAVMEHYEDIKDAGPSMSGYHLKRQLLSYIFPYHPAAIKYYKEKGVWTTEHQKVTDRLLGRQDVLATAWKSMKSRSVSDDKFAGEWLKVRAASLKAAGLPVVFN